MTVLDGGAEPVTPALYHSVQQPCVAEGDVIPEAGLALGHFPTAERERTPRAGGLYVAVNEGDVIPKDHRPFRPAFDNRIENTAAVPHHGMLQETVLHNGVYPQMDTGIKVRNGIHGPSPSNRP
jgi:hypothetical protein